MIRHEEPPHAACYNFDLQMERPGIYIHIPFCRTRCSYCDFATGAYETEIAKRYVNALCDEIEAFSRDSSKRMAADTIYFGGGTPSLLSPGQVQQILDAVHRQFAVEENAEVTMEMNPGTVTPASLRELRSVGINRASYGAQTFSDSELRRLGRSHTAQDVRDTIRFLRDAGFDNTSFDLIAGLPAQTLEAWAENLDEALALHPEHLSFYLLEVHEGTPLAAQIKRGQQPAPDDELAGEMYRMMLDRASVAGYEHYEISNLCRPGFESRHNSKYWTGAAVFGFGCSAHSFDGANMRWSNERDAARYVELIEAGKTAVVETIDLNEQQVRAESIFLGLRLMRGLDLRQHRVRFGKDLRDDYADDLDRFRDAGLIEIDDDLLKLTRNGVLLSNEVFAAFV
jgi:oxygen-independent coproporphyrinogen-3 oxidase